MMQSPLFNLDQLAQWLEALNLGFLDPFLLLLLMVVGVYVLGRVLLKKHWALWITAALVIALLLSFQIPLAERIDQGLTGLTDQFSGFTKSVSQNIETMIEQINSTLLAIHPLLLIVLFTLATFFIAGRNIAIGTAIALVFLFNLELWPDTIQTLTMVLLATLLAMLIGLPLGIIAALSKGMQRSIMPVLDFMQTMPAFVYLIPAIPFFGLGPVSAIFATVIFSMPPAIRLTALGILQVPKELTEAADAFGATSWQKLYKVQLPIAIPTIMAGVNQTIMLALSMVVIAAMIGAEGLGGEVWRAIQRLQAGNGFAAGIAVVVLAMILDRITQKVAQNSQKRLGR